MLMTWFILAFVINTLTDQPDIKINLALKFKNEQSCNEYLVQNKAGLNLGLNRTFPHLRIDSIICVDRSTAKEIQQQRPNVI
tara:strand:- start:252 stop:497 length:246 start_codon:yes stop_codon:yes gene_type:complete